LAAAVPYAFELLQGNPARQFLCGRPREVADPVPVTLLQPIFAQFVDDCQNHQPTDDDNHLVAELSHKMCSFYRSKLDRMHEFRQIFENHGVLIHLGIVGSPREMTDGHLLFGNSPAVILEGKNEIGEGSAEPFAEAMFHYRMFLAHLNDPKVFTHKVMLPCFLIVCFGKFILTTFLDPTDQN